MTPAAFPARCLRLFALACLFAIPAMADEGEIAPPPYLELLDHGNIEVSPGWRFDSTLQRDLDRALARMGVQHLVDSRKLGVALVDVSGPFPLLAEVNGTDTVYAASVPKIAVLYAAFQARAEGRVEIDDAFWNDLNRMVRVSSNSAASACIRRLGFNYINSVLWQSGLYDPEMGGGLWVGKAYGGPGDYWHRDPVANKSHAASPLALARMLTLLSQDRLVDEWSSEQMRTILGNPGIHHKFVKGLECRPGSQICRKSGTWSLWHGDAALVERGGKRYVAVALCETPDGQRLLERLIVALDDCVPEPSATIAASGPAPAAQPASTGRATRSGASF